MTSGQVSVMGILMQTEGGERSCPASPLPSDIIANKGMRWSVLRGHPRGPHTSGPCVMGWRRPSAMTSGACGSSALSSPSAWRLEGRAGV